MQVVFAHFQIFAANDPGMFLVLATFGLTGYIAYFLLQWFVEFLIGERQFSIRRILYLTALIAIALAMWLQIHW